LGAYPSKLFFYISGNVVHIYSIILIYAKVNIDLYIYISM
jgi:hypothetical protein